MRRKPAALLMFLVTRPGHSATREQVLDELWPDGDPEAASNSLNQSLHFLRRDIDPWFEDDISAEYVSFQGDLVWLDPVLCRSQSAVFGAAARDAMANLAPVGPGLDILSTYAGPFCPEFEYEEWAIPWRTRTHAQFLQLANAIIDDHAASSNFSGARDAALLALERDPSAADIERKLVATYWKLGGFSAARAQYEHLVALAKADGFEPEPLAVLVREALPRVRE
jgi:DNA-binding SARP family transcriptional activator